MRVKTYIYSLHCSPAPLCPVKPKLSSALEAGAVFFHQAGTWKMLEISNPSPALFIVWFTLKLFYWRYPRQLNQVFTVLIAGVNPDFDLSSVWRVWRSCRWFWVCSISCLRLQSRPVWVFEKHWYFLRLASPLPCCSLFLVISDEGNDCNETDKMNKPTPVWLIFLWLRG